MSDENKEGSSIPISGIVGVVLLAATIVAQQVQLESPRPAPQGPKRTQERPWIQKVDSRLWQDPMAVVAQYRDIERGVAAQKEQLARQVGIAAPANRNGLIPPDDRHEIRRIVTTPTYDAVCNDHESVRLLAAMVLGGPAEEDAEMRRRTRYAVVTGLMNAGYVPDNAAAIGYAYVPAQLRADYTSRLPETVPFEWFKRRAKAAAADSAGKERWEWILTLWLDQAVYYAEPLRRLRHLVDTISPRCSAGQPRWLNTSVLGPVDSASLNEIVNDINRESASGNAPVRGIPLQLVSASATASIDLRQPVAAPAGHIDAPLPQGDPPPSSLAPSQYYLRSRDTTLMRVIGPDQRLLDALIEELGVRNQLARAPLSDRKPAVIVVNEHDTDYGRDFVEQMTKKAEEIRKKDPASAFVVQPFSYLRQIDGGQPAASSARNAGSESEKAQSSRYSRSQGPQHVDYLRRLVDAIRNYRDDEATGRKDIAAIAVFGNDVYDKMLVMRALKPAFPKALFLTTDFDARLLDREESQWMSNVVVATNYELALSATLQRGVAPFRDGYQTATYLAALLIGGNCAADVIQRHDNNPPWLKSPLLYEIGRTRPVPLDSQGAHAAQGNFSGCTFADDFRPASVAVQPAVSRPGPPLGTIFTLLGLVLLVTGFGRYILPLADSDRAFAISPGLRYADRRHFAIAVLGTGTGLTGAWLLDLVAGPAAMYFGLLYAVMLCAGFSMLQDGLPGGASRMYSAFLIAPTLYLLATAVWPVLTGNAEPFAWLEGVSVWPTQLLRFLAALLAIYAIWRIGTQSVRDTDDIGSRFGLRTARVDDNPNDMAVLWNDYVATRRRRVLFTIVFAFGYLVIGSFAMYMLDTPPGIPVRGEQNLYAVQKLLGYVVYLSVALLVAVALAYRGFIMAVLRPAANADVAFPESSPARDSLPAAKGAGSRRYIDRVLVVELAAERTSTLTDFIYFPFAVCALMVVARSPLFDKWDTPVVLAVVLLLPFAIVISCVAWLRMETIRFHKKVLADMRAEMIRLRGAPDMSEACMWQFERLYERVRNESRGSFQNLALQPLIRALLLPIGGFSGIEILQHVVLGR